MTGGIVISHGDYSRGMVQALEMIAGKQEKLAAVALNEGEGLAELTEKIREEIAGMGGEDVILFTDMFGATPCNAASLICAELGCPVAAGVNLPVLLTFALGREEFEGEALLEQLAQASKEGFRILREKDFI